MESCTETMGNRYFRCKPKKQKCLIEILLNYSNYDLKSMAIMLSVPVCYLLAVYRGKSYLVDEAEVRLSELFLMLFSE